MSAEDDSPSKCSRKTALILFFAAEILAFVFSLIALISPTWQYVNLENGRTEHHHGLWLDCKRDYSHEYGRNREFYETLNRLDIQQHPFDHFFLPSLDCVYKFDYYIDTEDLYDHNHDENRLQDDANQHLFLGWKIAALSAFGLAVLATGAALLLCICAFCHKTLICATTVLVCVATVLSSIGISVFYIWANYQDNNIIKEDDGIYEQYFGWAFYVQIVGTCLHFVASFLGCVATSIAFTRVKAKLVKIEVVDEDNSSLLDEESKRPFKRSFSAIYKVDSAALRQWEKDYMNKVKEGSFIKQRTGSMPNIRRGERFQQRSKLGGQFKSSSQMFLDSCSSNPTLTTNTFDSTSERILSFTNTSEGANFKTPALKPSIPTNERSINGSDITYEVLPCDTSFSDRRKVMDKRLFKDTGMKREEILETSLNTYDKVYEPKEWAKACERYEEPRSRNSLSSFAPLTSEGSVKSFTAINQPTKSTLINDIAIDRPHTAEPQLLYKKNSYSDEECMTSSEFLQLRNEKKRLDDRKSSFGALKCEVLPKSSISKKPVDLHRSPQLLAENDIRKYAVSKEETNDFEEVLPSLKSDVISINTFDVGRFTKDRRRSITNLTAASSNDENVRAFDRNDFSETNSVRSFLSANKLSEAPFEAVTKKQLTSNNIRSFFNPEEIDRSVGSSAVLENDAVTDCSYNYLKEAELRLNLFMNDVTPLNKPDNLHSSNASKETNVTTV